MAFKVGSQTVIDISVATGETQLESATGKNIALVPDQHTRFTEGCALIFEGATADDFETTLTVADPTADRTLTLPDSTGTLATQAYVTSAVTSGALSDTDALAEGSTNLYYTNTRARTEIEGADLDLAGNKVLFANKYDNLVDLPNATTYHGMFAHVHATGKAYYAHGGNWVALVAEGSANNLTNSNFVSFHSTAYVVTNSDYTTNQSGTVDITFSELTDSIHYDFYINRTLVRPDEYSVSGTIVTWDQGLLDEEDEIEVSGFKIT
tara:strand:- start:227 stop:1024 length:798 start_codon:yes stop_codon:yes gene_type:complete